MNGRDRFKGWGLAEVTRATALLIGTYGTFVADTADKSVILAFAGGLLLAPNVISSQSRRNERRENGQ